MTRGEKGKFDASEQILVPAQHSLLLVGRPAKPEGTVLDIRGVVIGGTELPVIAGPCSVEGEEQLLLTARAVKAGGGSMLRGGAFKPRSSPYSFQGMKEEGLKLLARAREETGLPIVTEILDTRQLDLICKYADVIQVGSRSMQNYPMLEEVGRCHKPVLLKRGMSATIEEFLLCAEYVMKGGNREVILCERGIRTFETATRNTLDLNAVPMLKRLSHLPVIVDPSHGTGVRSLVTPLAKAAVAVGADGLIVEVHPEPLKAMCDGPQSLDIPEFIALMKKLKSLSAFNKKKL
jgi:3-deoxy-7-phosphoheptulonate synthase